MHTYIFNIFFEPLYLCSEQQYDFSTKWVFSQTKLVFAKANVST